MELHDLTPDVKLFLDGCLGDRIRVCVIPQDLDSDQKINEKLRHHKEVAKVPGRAIAALTTPLCLEGTCQELDAEMADQLTKINHIFGTKVISAVGETKRICS
jgi:PRTRC genetic system protein E